MPGPPTNIPALEMTRPDGSLFSRAEMEAQIREKWTGHQPKRLRAMKPYGLLSKIAMSTPTIIITHWILDMMIHRGEITGEKLGIDLTIPGQYDDPEVFNQFKQQLLLAIERGQALQPEKREGIDMNNMKLPPHPGASPLPNNTQAGFTPPPAPSMPGGNPPMTTLETAPTQPQAAVGSGLFPKEDINRPWGKPSPTANRSRRTKQELGEDQLWEKLGKPTDMQFGTFEQVYGLPYEKAKKQKKLGLGGEFPDISIAAPQPTTTPQQQQVPEMNQPPIPMPPNTHAATNYPPAPPAPPAPAAPPAGYPPQAVAPPAPPAPPMPGATPPNVPQAHPQAPPVPPAPGMGAPPLAPGMAPMAPQGFTPPTPPVTAPVDLTPILNRLAVMEERQIAIDAAIALQLRGQYQNPGEYTCTSVLKDILDPR